MDDFSDVAPSFSEPDPRVLHPNAAGDVKAPAMVLAVFTAITMVLIAFGIVSKLTGIEIIGAADGVAAAEESAVAAFRGILVPILGVIGLVGGGVIIHGCLKMMKLESHGLAVGANIIAMIPCVSPCCLIGIPVGFWGLAVLTRPEIKAAFRS